MYMAFTLEIWGNPGLFMLGLIYLAFVSPT
jgi:hypothetical protein